MRATMACAAVSTLLLAGCSGAVEAEASPSTMAVGECRDSSTIPVGQRDDYASLPVVDCADAHAVEVFHVVPLEGEDYPTDVAVQAQNLCYAAFEDYVGIPYDESAYFYTATYPAPAAWGSGGEQITCLIVGDEGEVLTGSAEGSER